MRFLQSDLCPTQSLPLRSRKCYSERACVTSLDSLSVQQRRAPSMRHVMAYPRFRRRDPYAATSRGRYAWQGASS